MIEIDRNSDPELIRKHAEAVIEVGSCPRADEKSGMKMSCSGCPYNNPPELCSKRIMLNGAKRWLFSYMKISGAAKLFVSAPPATGKRDDRIELALAFLTDIDADDDRNYINAVIKKTIAILEDSSMAPVEVDGKECPPVLVPANPEGYDREGIAYRSDVDDDSR